MKNSSQVEPVTTSGTGTVTKFDQKRGFGMIQPDDSNSEIYVHINTVIKAGILDSMIEGATVRYTLTTKHGHSVITEISH